MGSRFGETVIWTAMISLVLLLPVAAAGYVVKDESYFLQDGVMTPEEMVEEGEYLKGLCEGNAYQALYFDCGCLGEAFTAKRQELGPDVYQNTIIEGLTQGEDAVCPNSEGIRAEKYESCAADIESGMIQSFVTDYNSTKEEQLGYCQCAADRFVEVFSAAPRLSTSYIRKIAVDSNVACLKPENR